MCELHYLFVRLLNDAADTGRGAVAGGLTYAAPVEVADTRRRFDALLEHWEDLIRARVGGVRGKGHQPVRGVAHRRYKSTGDVRQRQVVQVHVACRIERIPL